MQKKQQTNKKTLNHCLGPLKLFLNNQGCQYQLCSKSNKTKIEINHELNINFFIITLLTFSILISLSFSISQSVSEIPLLIWCEAEFLYFFSCPPHFQVSFLRDKTLVWIKEKKSHMTRVVNIRYVQKVSIPKLTKTKMNNELNINFL